MDDIEKVKIQISDDPSNDFLIFRLENLEVDLNNTLEFETKGLMFCSRTRWMEGEKSSKYFCTLEKRSCERNVFNKIKDDNGDVIYIQSV